MSIIGHPADQIKLEVGTILEQLELVSGPLTTRHGGEEWKARCPLHNDTNPSLSVTENADGGISARCWAGCSSQDLARALGVPEWMPGGLTHQATYDYVTAEGDLVFQVLRGSDASGQKHIRQRVPDSSKPSGFSWSLKGLAPDQRSLLFHAPLVRLAVESNDLVYLVEGEKDALTAAEIGLVATTNAGGAGKFTDRHAQLLAGAHVRIIQDNDDVGRRHGAQAHRMLQGVAASVELFDVPADLPEKADLTDMILAGYKIEDLVHADPIDLVSSADSPHSAGGASVVGVRDGDILDGIAAALWSDACVANRLAAALRDRWIFTGATGWHWWNGCVWERETDDTSIIKAIQRHAEREVRVALETGGDLTGSVRRLSKSAIVAASVLLRGLLQRDFAEFDTDPYILVTPETAVDLRTGNTLPHDPTRLVTRMTPVRYVPGARHSDWDQALTAVAPDVADYLQLRFGQAATGLVPDDDRIVILQGGGENGKSTILASIMEALGDYSTMLPRELFMGRSDVHPTVIMPLKGCRLGVKEEAAEGGVFDMLRVKEVVGTKIRRGRFMHHDFVEFEATDSLFISSNHDLQIMEGDDGSWRRFIKVVFPFRYRKPHEPLLGPMDRHGDPRLRHRLTTDDAAQEAVLAWLVDGARRWIASDETMPEPPASVAADTQSWRDECDPFHTYAADNLIADPTFVIWVDDLYAELMSSLIDGGQKRWSKPTFRRRLEDSTWRKRAGVSFTGRVRLSTLAGNPQRPLILSRPIGADVLKPPPEQGQYLLGFRFRSVVDHPAHIPSPAPAPTPAPTPEAGSGEPVDKSADAPVEAPALGAPDVPVVLRDLSASPTVIVEAPIKRPTPAPADEKPAVAPPVEMIRSEGRGGTFEVPRVAPPIKGLTIAELGGAAS
ncbi:phage/plasmid primase, P4 family [Brachybacterium endophyticum]|nr:phage/plasmid primase, P4 family [Brachybacterium endophyticum]